MKKKMLLLALLPAYQAIAQVHTEHEDMSREPVPSMLTTEIRNMELKLSTAPEIKMQTDNTGLLFSSVAEQQKLKESFDYFPPEDVLNGRIDHPGVPHNIATTHFSNVSLKLEGKVYENLDCYEIKDRYRIKAGKELPGDYQYNNTYFLYKNADGEILATAIYVESKIGNLKSEYRIVKKGLAAVTQPTLTVFPNPASKNITISFKVTVPGAYSLSISGIEGKTVMSVFDKKALREGMHTFTSALNLAPGSYLITLHAAQTAAVTQKLIIK